MKHPAAAVIGAGAAGLMTAIAAKRAGKDALDVHLFDSRKKIGAKILISGGTRCNVTNRSISAADYHGGAPHFISHIFKAFGPEATHDFFDSIGVKLILEPTGKYFPESHSAKTVLEALMAECHRLGVRERFGERVTGVTPIDGGLRLRTETGHEDFACAALCTGGLSLPETGSDGMGLQIAKTLGHTIIPTAPALTPYLTDDKDWPSLSGLSLEAELRHFKKGKKIASSKGGFLFTHFGFSGPAVLDLSRYWALAEPGDEPRVEVSFLPDEDEALFRKKLDGVHPTAESLARFLGDRLKFPKRFVSLWGWKCGFAESGPLGREWQKKVIAGLFHYPLPVSGVYGYKKAEVTSGGVDLKEVRVSDLSSKKVKGLYFAGEILDVDGRIGGFNFQWAWSTGAIAGAALAKEVAG